jgi:amino acid adenylation domain-containing protein
VQPSAEFEIAALATMLSGAAYLPLDPGWPAERLSFMLADSEVSALIAPCRLGTTIRIPETTAVISSDVLRGSVDQVSEDPPDADPDTLAYVIYTSGSAGQPKGVEITHAGLSNLVAWHNSTFRITDEDRASQVAGLGFDAAVWEIWPYLCAGATLCIPEVHVAQNPVELQSWLITERITVAFAPTSTASDLITMRWPAETSLRYLLTGGEALHRYPPPGLPFSLVNNYGPTECTVVATSGAVAPEQNTTTAPSIGRPIWNTEIHILDESLAPVPAGTPGEICIGGAGVAKGYRNRRELTELKFIPNPLSQFREARLYRTGDRAVLRPDGELQFLGRIDDQVKIRGYRIEPGEVVAALSQHPAVRQVVVVARKDEHEERLVAYVVIEGEPPTQRELRQFLQRTLPDHMIPAAFIRLDQLPLNESGKVDRSRLPAPTQANTLSNAATETPRTVLERRIAGIVRELLELDEVGLDDNFFMLGGHSLLGAQLIARLANDLNLEISLRDLFEAPTIGMLSAQFEFQMIDSIASLNSEHGF